MTAPGEAISLVIQNLRPGTRYRFKVFAENRHGLGVESQTVTARTADEGGIIFIDFFYHTLPFHDIYIFGTAPASPPRNIEVLPRSSSALEITWDSPPFSHWNSEYLSYKIGYKYGHFFKASLI